MNHHRKLRHVAGWSTVALAAASALGCSMFNPYETIALDEPKSPDGLQLAGGADEGIRRAETLRQQYYADLRQSAITRNWTATAASVLSGWTLYNALKPRPEGATAIPLGDTRRAARLGATFTSLYLLREFFVNPEQEKAHAEGYRALTCMMLQSRPLLMTQATPGAPPNGELDRLKNALTTLDARTTAVYELAARNKVAGEALAGRWSDEPKDRWHPLRGQLDETYRGLAYARHALDDGAVLVETVESVGHMINDRAGVIASSVNLALQDKQHAFDVRARLKDASSFATSVRAIGADTASDEAAGGSPGDPIGRWLAPDNDPMRRFAWFDGTARSGLFDVAAAAKKTPMTKSDAAALTPAIDELKRMRDALDAVIRSAASRQAEAEANAKLAKLNARIKELEQAQRDAADAAFNCGTRMAPMGAQACATELAIATERLHAARRPVVQAILNVRAMTRTGLSVPDCIELEPLRVSPNEVIRARPGDVINYFVTQREAGTPAAVLNGPGEGKAGAALKFAASQGTSFTATVTLGPRIPPQTLRLVVSDSRGAASQTLRIVVGRPPVPELPATPASGASAAETKT